MAQSIPNDTLKLFHLFLEAAESFGFKNGENGLLRDCVKEKQSNELKTVVDNETNFWFGIVREDQGPSGPYEGLSIVIFPEHDGTHCTVAIGIGSSSIGADAELAAKVGFARSFKRLQKNNDHVQFFFKNVIDEMATPTPGLDQALRQEDNYAQEMIGTTAHYDTDKDHIGLLPLAFICDYHEESSWKLILAWLAQYAKWRNWYYFKKGTIQAGKLKNIEDAIGPCVLEKECPNQSDVYNKLLKRRFIVLQGAPGCGKTWTANEIANTYFKDRNSFIQFHAETSYSDFVYGIKPLLNGKDLAYSAEKGILLKALDEAANDSNSHLLIIDEFNRANLANVLGPVFYLFEQNNQNHTHRLVLGKDSNGKDITYTHIPENLYVIATMNTADKSLAVVDFALRRRFSWITLRPHALTDNNFDKDLFNAIDAIFMEYATDEELNLQPGQSYFLYSVSKKNNEGFLTARKDTIIYGLMPLMKEYFAEGFLLSAKEKVIQLFFEYTGVAMYE